MIKAINKLSLLSLAHTVNKLQDFSLTNSQMMPKGWHFKNFYLIKKKMVEVNFLPRANNRFCVGIIQPKSNETIIDPACGSGGFLNSSFNYILNNNKNVSIEKVVSENLYGLDINKSIARIAKMKLLLEAT